MTTLRHDMTLTGKPARRLRGACAFMLVAAALAACTPSPERAARIAVDKTVQDMLDAVNLDRMNRAMALTMAHCPAILAEEGVAPFLARMQAKAAKIGPRMSPPVPVRDGHLIDGELLEGATTPGIALRVETRDVNAAERAKIQRLMMGDDLPDIRIGHQCGADLVLFSAGPSGVVKDGETLWAMAPAQSAPFAKAVGGQVAAKGNATMRLPPRVVTADRSYSMTPMKLLQDDVGIAPEIFHDDKNPVQVGDKLRYYLVYQTGLYIESTQR